MTEPLYVLPELYFLIHFQPRLEGTRDRGGSRFLSSWDMAHFLCEAWEQFEEAWLGIVNPN